MKNFARKVIFAMSVTLALHDLDNTKGYSPNTIAKPKRHNQSNLYVVL